MLKYSKVVNDLALNDKLVKSYVEIMFEISDADIRHFCLLCVKP